MTPWRKATALFVTIGLFVVIVFDSLAAAFGGDGATISELTRDVSTARPVIAAALSVLLGHLLWPADPALPRWKLWAQVGVLWAAALALFFLGAWVTVVVAVAAFPTGRLLWWQRAPAPTTESAR